MASQLCVSTLHTISTHVAYFGEVVDLGHVIQQQQHPLKCQDVGRKRWCEISSQVRDVVVASHASSTPRRP